MTFKAFKPNEVNFFFLFRAASVAYGSSQARGLIGAAAVAFATATATATAMPEPSHSSTYTAACGNARSLTTE